MTQARSDLAGAAEKFSRVYGALVVIKDFLSNEFFAGGAREGCERWGSSHFFGGRRKPVGKSAAGSLALGGDGTGLAAPGHRGAGVPRPPKTGPGFVLIPTLNMARRLTLKCQRLAADFSFIKDTATY